MANTKLLILGQGSGGGSGTTDYNDLENKPKINGTTLEGDVTIDFGSLDKAIVDELPTEDIDTNTIYMVPKETSESGDVYDEYMYINGAWEHIGSTQVDLSDYYTKEEVDSINWFGTQEEYDAITEKDPDIIYHIEGGEPSNATITIKQGDEEKGSFTLNQDGDATIELSEGGSSSKQWFGTQAEFDALTEYDADTDYYISTKLDYSEIKNAPDPTKYYTKVEIDAKETTLNAEIASKANIAVGMTQEEFDEITPLEGTDYLIEGETVELTFTLEDGTTVTHHFVIDD